MADVGIDRERARRSFASFVALAWNHIGDPRRFVWSWHVDAMAEECQDLTDGAFLRSVLNVPPGSAKSTITGVLWPAWVWGPRATPDARWMFASYDASLMLRDARRLEVLLDSAWYRERWGTLLTPGARALHDLRTRAGGGRFSTSIMGKALGRHANYQVIDDPIKATDAVAISGVQLDKVWQTIDETFSTRAIDPPTFRRMIVGQRIGEGDPSERALAQGWHSCRLPMRAEVEEIDPRDRRTAEGELLSPSRWPLDWCEQFERENPDTWSTQYQQRPAVKGGAIWKEEVIERYAVSLEDWQALDRKSWSVQSWDFTFKGEASLDWVAGQWWRAHEDHYFLCPDPIHEPLSFTASIARMREQFPIWPTSRILVEDKANGPAIENALRDEFPHVIELATPQGSKPARAHACAPLFAAGRVHVVRGPGYEKLVRLWSRFPRVRRDDPVDAATQALLDLTKDAGWFGTLGRLRAP